MASLGYLIATLFLFATVNTAYGQSSMDAIKIVTFGTSLTSRGTWPDDLGRQLRSCMKSEVQITRIARAGATTEWALTQLENIRSADPDIVFLEFYANDSAINRFMSVGRSQQNFSRIIEELRNFDPNTKIVMLKMNPFFSIRGWLRPFSHSFVEAHLEEIDKRQMNFIDLSEDWSLLSPAELQQAIPDGLHPKDAIASQIIVPRLAAFVGGDQCLLRSKDP